MANEITSIGSQGAFTTWLASLPAKLASPTFDDYIAELTVDISLPTSGLAFTTATALHRVIIRGAAGFTPNAAGAPARYDATKVRLFPPFNSNTTCSSSVPETLIFENIQIYSGGLGIHTFAAGVLVRNCVIYMTAGGGQINFNGGVKNLNNIILCSATATTVPVWQGVGQTCAGCTFITLANQIVIGLSGTYGNNFFFDNAAFNLSGGAADPWPTIPTSFYHASSTKNSTNMAAAGNCPGTSPVLNATGALCLTDATSATLDARPKAGSPLLAAGVTVSGMTTDFYNASRSGSTPSIGAVESAPVITPAPVFTTDPASQSVTAGATCTFTSSATNVTTYQWQRNGVDIAGATSANYTTPATTVTGGSANNGDVYRNGATGPGGGPVYSAPATLTVTAGADVTPPSLTGTITIANKTPTSFDATCPVGTDAVGVTQYRWGLGATPSSWTVIAAGGRTASITGQTIGSTVIATFQAGDAAGNWSGSLSQSVTLDNTSVTLGPFASSGTVWPSGTPVHYTWMQGGRIGVAPTSASYGTGTLGAGGTLLITGLPAGAGVGMVAQWHTDATDDDVGYHAATVV